MAPLFYSAQNAYMQMFGNQIPMRRSLGFATLWVFVKIMNTHEYQCLAVYR